MSHQAYYPRARRWMRLSVALLALASVATVALIVLTNLGPRGVTATALWDGSTFNPSTLAPYTRVNASGPGTTGQGPHTTTDTRGHGITMVPDPAGVRDASGAVRKVMKFRTDESKGDGAVVRMQLESPYLIQAEMTNWIYYEIFVPRNFPLISGNGAFFTTGSVFTGGGSGSGPTTMMIEGRDDGVNDHVWNGWRSGNIVPGRWHKIARRTVFTTSPATGRFEIWSAPLGEPLELQKSTRMATLVEGNNYKAGQGSFLRLGNYHSDETNEDYPAFVELYYANHKTFDGDESVSAIDPDD